MFPLLDNTMSYGDENTNITLHFVVKKGVGVLYLTFETNDDKFLPENFTGSTSCA